MVARVVAVGEVVEVPRGNARGGVAASGPAAAELGALAAMADPRLVTISR